MSETKELPSEHGKATGEFPPRVTLDSWAVYDDDSEGEVDYISMQEHEAELLKMKQLNDLAFNVIENYDKELLRERERSRGLLSALEKIDAREQSRQDIGKIVAYAIAAYRASAKEGKTNV